MLAKTRSNPPEMDIINRCGNKFNNSLDFSSSSSSSAMELNLRQERKVFLPPRTEKNSKLSGRQIEGGLKLFSLAFRRRGRKTNP
jgi:hypothetical protein